MASVSSVSFYSQLTARNKAIGGLATGLDTDALVEALTTTTRSKLAKQGQQKTLLNWKMSAYRGVASTLRAFSTKHLSMAAGANSLKAQAFFNVYKGTSTSDKITVKPSDASQTGSFKVDSIKQLATSQSFSTKQFDRDLQGDDVSTTQDYLGKSLQVSMNGSTKTIRLDDLQGKSHAAGTSSGSGDPRSAFEETFQNLIDNAFGANVITVDHSYDNVADTFNLKLDGAATSTKVAIMNTADSLGLSSKMSNRVDLNTKIEDFLANEGTLVGDTLKFSLNDTVITVNRDDTVQTLLNRINNAAAGVTASFNSITESFVIASKTLGDGDNLKMKDVQGNLLNLFVGAQGGTSFASEISYTAVNKTGSALDVRSMLEIDSSITDLEAYFKTEDGQKKLNDLANYKLKVTVGDTSLTLTGSVASYKDAIKNGEMGVEEAILTSMNAQLDKKFGEGKVTFSFSGVDSNNDPDPTTAITLSSTVRDQSIKLGKVTGSSTKDLLDATGLQAETLNSKYDLAYTKSFAVSSDAAGLLGSLAAGTGYELNMTVNGQTKTLSFSLTAEEIAALSEDLPADATEAAKTLKTRQESLLVYKLNTAKNAAFGTDGDPSKVKFSAKDGELLLSSTLTEGSFSLSAADTSGSGSTNLLSSYAGMENHTGGGTTIGDLGLGSGSFKITVGSEDVTVNYTAGTTLYSVIKQINEGVGRDVVSFSDGSLTLDAGVESLSFDDLSGDLMKTVFGQSSYVSGAKAGDFDQRVEDSKGQNAVIVIDGQEVISSTNTFEYNGVSFEVSGVSSFQKDSNGDLVLDGNGNPICLDDPITINVSADPDDVVEKLKVFIEEYNVLLDALNGMINEKATAGYEPLTDEQKAEMTEDQIKSWETEAKKGLLRNDSTIRSVLDQMRGILYESVESAGISLYDIGITTESFSTTGYKGYGRLEMTEAGEKQLRSMLESNPDAVRELFTNTEEGLAVKMEKIIDDATRTNSTDQGTLVALAGTEATTGNNVSTLSRKLELIEQQIERLQNRLESEYNRYWKKFSALETAISGMNTQSSWLSSFGG